ncbi:transglutaminase family protein [Trujillonella endophytica]|uniref:Transglutaminase-like enzyme, putative cysteine protease n=1 Tax=Trujillonella endophytica TaxID=673521 RepID=A0A1H8W9M1_9ACTN|nr:transglutaminase family protein [Trujillella endophytica]SEP24355.1 Transglutaminase-like enzyme, putative cysteine protease [Trujillella endophytica]
MSPQQTQTQTGSAQPDGPAPSRWRLQVVHRSRFSYGGPVRSSYNEARLTPENGGRQTTLRSRVEIEPAATAFTYRDYWGSTVTAFDLHTPHEELVVTGTSIVEAGPEPVGHEHVGWEVLRGAEVRDQYGELLVPTRLTNVDAEVGAQAREVAGDLPPHEAAAAVCRFVNGHMEYLSGATHVKTTAMQAWRHRKGVCQDISHVTVGMLRALGLPARYVSGYLHPKRDAVVGQTVTGESHAWVEWWDGGWCAFDPTNSVEVGTRHVTLGRGRDYGDVSPFRGIFSGAGSEGHTVSVEVTRLA